MGQRRTSLKEIAEQLGVSIATVSRAIRDSHEVGDEMKDKVKALAKKLNYRPNPFAQSLKRNAPKVIGVVVPNLVTHYYAAVLDGIEDYATKAGYAVITANSHEDHLREEKAIDNFAGMYVVGIIACLAQDTVDYSHFIEINDMGIPLVFFARTCLPEMFSSVVSNGDEAAKEEKKAVKQKLPTEKDKAAKPGRGRPPKEGKAAPDKAKPPKPRDKKSQSHFSRSVFFSGLPSSGGCLAFQSSSRDMI